MGETPLRKIVVMREERQNLCIGFASEQRGYKVLVLTCMLPSDIAVHDQFNEWW